MPATPSAGTARNPYSAIGYDSPFPAVFDLLKYFGGQKTTTGGGSATTTGGDTTTSVQGNIDPLMQVFGAQMDPAALSAMVQDLFSQGAAKVPGLTAQYANATGTRTSKNSMLSESLAMLNSDLARTIAQSIVANTANASTTAGKIADASKVQTVTNQPKTVTETGKTVTVAPGGAANKAGLATMLGGFALNKFGDKLLGKEKGVVAGAPTASMGDAGLQYGADQYAGYAGLPTIDAPAAVSGYDVPSLTVDTFAPPVAEAFPVADIGANLVSEIIPSAAVDVASTFAPEIADVASTAFDVGSEFVGTAIPDAPIEDIGGNIWEEVSNWFFADGGRVGYAEGGSVRPPVRNFPNFGAIVPPETTRPEVVKPVLQLPVPPPVRIPTVPIPTQQTPAPVRTQRREENTQMASIDASGGEGTNATEAGGVASTGLTAGQGISLASLANAALSANPIGLAIAALSLGVSLQTGKSIAQHVTEAITGTQPPAPVEDAPPMVTPEASPAEATAPPAPAPEGSVQIGTDADNAAIAAQEAADAAAAANAAVAAEASTAVSADADAAAAAVAGGTVGGDTGGSSDGGGDGFAEGGRVGDNKVKMKIPGVDTEKISATIGEYVLPVDVVDFLGKDMLDELVALLHTPVRGGTRG